MSDRASTRRRVLASVVLLILIALPVWKFWHSRNKPTPAPQSAQNSNIDPTLAAGRAPAGIRSAVLYDSYDHARENVPPRNDTSARADAWQPPPMPLATARATITDKTGPDGALLAWMEDWDRSYRAGVSTRNTPLLTSLLDRTKLGFEPLFNLGAAMGFLEEPSVATVFHRAALRRTNEEYKNLSPLHPAAPLLRVALPQMGMYWNSGDYPLLEERFKIEMQLYPPLSQESRKCAHSCAEAMYYQGKQKEAADLIATKVQRDEQAGDLSASDKQEMGWIVGIMYREDRLKESIAGLTLAAQSGGGRAMQAIQAIQMKILNLPPDQMEQQLVDLEKSRLSAEQMQMVRTGVNEYAARRALSGTRPAMTMEQRLALRRAQEAAASRPAATQSISAEQRLQQRRMIETGTQATTRPATRPALTPQQLAVLEAQRVEMAYQARAAASRPSIQRDAAAIQAQRQYQSMMEQQRAAAAAAAQQLAPDLRALLKSNPRQAVDRLLNRGEMQMLLSALRFAEVDELGIAAIIAASRDTWQVEQLQRFRVRAFFSAGKQKEALAAARAEFNVGGMGSVPYDLTNIANALSAAYMFDPAMPNRFRLQQLAGAQADSGQRKKLLSELGENIMASIQVDAAPFKDAIAQRQSASDYDTLYSLGNLLLISGRISEAREVFEKVYKIAPPGEVNYASEAIAKVIKAEDGCIGRANQFVAAIRPKE
jgi:hypothetical protein